ncbi:MAG: hypothetical protein COU68_01780, partial [Candidatus Pacebacteria bacterium CG10_big_fil_rev_8_21_14_0_10_45_6]
MTGTKTVGITGTKMAVAIGFLGIAAFAAAGAGFSLDRNRNTKIIQEDRLPITMPAERGFAIKKGITFSKQLS